jgi:hypothetical protein
MSPKWLIEKDTLECTEKLIESLVKFNIEYQEIHSSVRFKDDFLSIFKPYDCVIFYGSLELAKRIRKKAKWVPGVFYNVEQYNCTYYYAKLGKYLLNENYIMMPYGELSRRKEFLYEMFGEDRAVFIRPNRGDKIFTGKVVYKENFEKDIRLFNFYQMADEELVIVARPINITCEWRFVVVNQEVITGSVYKENDRVGSKAGYDIKAFELASKIAKEYNPDPAYVIDICLTKTGDYRLMEVGCFSCAGMYLCDTDIIVEKVSDVVLKEWRNYNEGCC